MQSIQPFRQLTLSFFSARYGTLAHVLQKCQRLQQLMAFGGIFTLWYLLRLSGSVSLELKTFIVTMETLLYNQCSSVLVSGVLYFFCASL